MDEDSVVAISTVFSNEIWFVLGMSISAFDVKLKSERIQGMIGGLFFLFFSILTYVSDIHNDVVAFALGLLACASVVALMVGFEDNFGRCMDFFAKYTMPIFLMHTLFAAPLRVVLLKIGITNTLIHVILGLSVSFLGPIIAAWVMKKIKWLEFFLYPNKFVKI